MALCPSRASSCSKLLYSIPFPSFLSPRICSNTRRYHLSVLSPQIQAITIVPINPILHRLLTSRFQGLPTHSLSYLINNHRYDSAKIRASILNNCSVASDVDALIPYNDPKR